MTSFQVLESTSFLRILHLFVAWVHIVTACVVSFASDTDLSVQLFLPSMSIPDRGEGDWLAAPGGSAEKSGIVPIAFTVVCMECIAAVFHFCNAVVWPTFYLSCLRNRFVPLRWVEYSITAPISVTLVAMLGGTTDFYVLQLLAVLQGVTMAFGCLSEEYTGKVAENGKWKTPLPKRIQIHLLNWFPTITVWLMVALQLARYLSVNDLTYDTVPEWIPIIFTTQILYSFSLLILQLTYLLRHPIHYVKLEYMYVILSVIAKVALSCSVLMTTTQLQRDNRGTNSCTIVHH